MGECWNDAEAIKPPRAGRYLVVVSVFGNRIPEQLERHIYDYSPDFYSWNGDGWTGNLDYVHGRVIRWSKLPTYPNSK